MLKYTLALDVDVVGRKDEKGDENKNGDETVKFSRVKQQKKLQNLKSFPLQKINLKRQKKYSK
jgi:hypothetical protein